ncbi:UNKNOWN [Stylonychia lemnae]|uniref:Uncharacterized protein n=1 Tax=Stylonychia lemnae TaxID=5949 RepID=A0A078A2T4_STYLE|nr:UNKNOWN [Stylonychia lemnae]|eukprot:CDW76583.1 UNKNOWN [Stylonychia lemnae]
MRDKERIEQKRLKERVGGYHKYVDCAQINNPDPTSTYHVDEHQRFNKDHAVTDKSVRAQHFEKQQSKWANLRIERLERDQKKWEKYEVKEQFQENRIKVKAEVYQAAKKNMGGSAYNIINLDYDRNKEGIKLQQVDHDAKVRALIRSKNLDSKNNNGFNILTGEQRQTIVVPSHERYNPLTSAGSHMLSSSHSQRSVLISPVSQQSQRILGSRGYQQHYQTGSGVLPGMTL